MNRVSGVPGCGVHHPFYLLCHPGELGGLGCSLPRSSVFSTDSGVLPATVSWERLRLQINPGLSLSPYEPAPHTTTGPESTCLTDYAEDFCVQQETTGKSAWVVPKPDITRSVSTSSQPTRWRELTSNVVLWPSHDGVHTAQHTKQTSGRTWNHPKKKLAEPCSW